MISSASLVCPRITPAGRQESECRSNRQKAGEALREYFAGGGTLIADAAGGSNAFYQAVQREVYPLVAEGFPARLDGKVVYTGLCDLGRVYYRRQFSLTLSSTARKEHRYLDNCSMPGGVFDSATTVRGP